MASKAKDETLYGWDSRNRPTFRHFCLFYRHRALFQRLLLYHTMVRGGRYIGPSCQLCRADDNVLFVWAFAHFFVCWLARWLRRSGAETSSLRQSRTAVGRCECPPIGHGHGMACDQMASTVASGRREPLVPPAAKRRL